MKSSRALTWAGVLITLLGIVTLIILQVDNRTPWLGAPRHAVWSYRAQISEGPLMVIALGLLVYAAGLTLGRRSEADQTSN